MKQWSFGCRKIVASRESIWYINNIQVSEVLFCQDLSLQFAFLVENSSGLPSCLKNILKSYKIRTLFKTCQFWKILVMLNEHFS